VNVTVGLTPVPMPTPPFVSPTIQNLGPGTVYFDRVETVTTETGVRIAVNTSYSVPGLDPFGRGGSGRDGGSLIWLVADIAATDVRFFT